MNFNAIFYFNPLSPKSYQEAVSRAHVKRINEVVHIPFFHPKCCKIRCVDCTLLVHLKWDTQWLSEMLDLDLHFIKLTVEKVDSLAQIVLNIRKGFPRMKSASIRF